MVTSYYKKLFNVLTTSSSKVAYKYYDETYSYNDMHIIMRKVNAIMGGMKNQAVAIYSDKTFEAYGAIFTTILSGNTWVPLSPVLPSLRCIEIFKMVDISVVFTDCELPNAIKAYLDETDILVVDLSKLIGYKEEVDITLVDFDPNNIAYIMFTSGSTGTPKGVPMTHVNYINFINNCMELLDFQQYDIFSDYHDFAFDISIFYLFCFPLVQGCISPVKTQQDRMLPVQFMKKNKITVWSSVPSVINRIQKVSGKGVDTNIRIMFLCGEPFPLPVLSYCFNKMNILAVYNFYGLTETGVENFYYPCTRSDLDNFKPYGYVPIGKPLPGNEVTISDEKELLISGCQLTPGYLGHIGKDKFSEQEGKKWFHTGDLVEIIKDNYFCKGRVDTQIKLRGYRIELMDIEVNLIVHPDIHDAICFLSKVMHRDVLVAVVTSNNNREIDFVELKRELKKSVPLYMIPDRFFTMEEFPVNSNGKKDRKLVREIYIDKVEKSINTN